MIHHVASGYVAVVRTTAAFTGYDDAVQALAQCDRALRSLDTDRLGILLDWRLAPLSTDSRLHAIIVSGADAFIGRFARRALLVSSPVGAMQGGRIVRVQSDTNPVIFSVEAEAVEYVTGRINHA